LVLEQYVRESLKKEVVNGIATPGQRDSVKGLKVLMDATLPDGRKIPKGSTAYIREELLHNHSWATKAYSCDTLSVKFLLVEREHIEFVTTPDEAA
jgi:hypothetical protein